MHPFVALMRKYCIDYTNSHDQSLYDEFMRPDYVVHSFGRDLPRDTYYSSGVEEIFRLAPGLGLVVHEFVLNGDRLAMHFSEHAAMPAGDRRALTCWRGIGLYTWDGERLVENWVEQDYFAMQRQIRTLTPDPIKAPHLDPWMWTEPVAVDPAAEALVREWLTVGDIAAAVTVEIDDMRVGLPYEAVLDVDDVVIDDIFSAGPRVPFHVTLHGRYRGGLGDALRDKVGEPTAMGVSGIATVAGGGVTGVEAVTCRVQAAGGLTGRLDIGF
jgi:hypothetical protein